MFTIPKIWLTRRDIFSHTVDEYLVWLDTHNPPRKKTAVVLLNNLKAFVQRQFERFDVFQGYLNKNPSDTPIIPFKMPDTECNLILDQAFMDFGVIQQAISQRILPGTAQHLDITDKLAWLALEPVRGNLDFYDSTVLTYLQKSPNIRLIPYSPVALVGMPYTGSLQVDSTGHLDTTNAVIQDILSIPHEIGHHVFWHSFFNPNGACEFTANTTLIPYLKKALLSEVDFVNRWAEEIFADTYSLAICGPVIAQSSSDVQQVIAGDKFFSDDGEHPSAVLRLCIIAKILYALGYQNEGMAVHSDWLQYCDQRRNNLWMNEKKAADKMLKIYDNAQWEPIDWVIGSTYLLNNQKTVDRVIQRLLDIVTVITGPSSWWQDYQNIAPGSSLYATFSTYLQHQAVQKLPSTSQLDSITAWTPNMVTLFPDIIQRPNYVYSEPYIRDILKISGWATRGSDKDPIPKIT